MGVSLLKRIRILSLAIRFFDNMPSKKSVRGERKGNR